MSNSRTTTPSQQLNPLVSCIVPTANRPAYLEQSISYFLEQNYSNKEMIIVYNTNADLPSNIPTDKNIYLVKTSQKNIGDKRNIACAKSHGQIIVHWDDDDLYDANRISYQTAPILAGECDITGLTNVGFFGLNDWSFWKHQLTHELLIEDVMGGSLTFSKRVWEEAGPYPSISLGEDSTFLLQALQKKARLKKLDGKNLYVYLRHHSNTWRFNLGEEMSRSASASPPQMPQPNLYNLKKVVSKEHWIKSNEFDLVRKNRTFYRKRNRELFALKGNLTISNPKKEYTSRAF